MKGPKTGRIQCLERVSVCYFLSRAKKDSGSGGQIDAQTGQVKLIKQKTGGQH